LLNPEIKLGHLGVRVFFVISGYLITGILLDAREQLATVGLCRTLKTFYARRALRIFPAYYAALAGAYILNLGDIRETIVWHAFYLSNILFIIENKWGWPTPHLWTLSVEEQFYLVWPFVVILTPRPALRWVLLGTVGASAVFRGYYFERASYEVAIWVATPASLDALATGGLLLLWLRSGRRVPTEKVLRWLLLPAAAITSALSMMSKEDVYIWGELLGLFPAVIIVAGAAIGFRGVLARGLEAKPLLFLGRISYGIYLYHLFVKAGMTWASERFGTWDTYERGPLMFLVTSGATIVAASISWYCLERPMLRLKNRLPYGTRRAAPRLTSGNIDADRSI
jgi:peptidoglycan/LPS O-acetylase OafA/YrhL